MKILACLSLLVFVITIPSLAPKATAQGTDVHIRIPVTQSGFFNECTGETVDFSGVFHFLFKIDEDGNGGFHLVEQRTLQNWSGVGDNGGVYKAVGLAPWHTTANQTSGGAYTVTMVTQQNWILVGGSGSGDNVLGHELFHFTFNANGELVSFYDEVTFECF